MSKIAAVLLTVILVAGCAGSQAGVPPPPPSSPEVAPLSPPLRYRIQYKDWGLLVVPGFGLIDRSKEWVVAPTEPTPFPEINKSEPQG